MTMAAESATSTGVLFGKRALQQLHVVLERETGPKVANLLREIGFAAGEAAHEGFEQWCRQTYHVDFARELDAAFLNEALSGFLSGAGWGAVRVSELAPNVLAFVEPMTDKEKKALDIDRDDELVAATLLTHAGAVVHPAFAPQPQPQEGTD